MRERVAELVGSVCDIVGSAVDGREAVDLALKLDPDLLLTDISMPILNGIQVASHLRDSGCRAKVVILTVHDDEDNVEAAFSTGAFGYVLKSRFDTDLIPAIQAALQGERYVSQFPARHL